MMTETPKNPIAALNENWPLWLIHWHETLVGWLLPVADGPEFRRSILAAVPAGVSEDETERWRHAIAVRRLRRLLQMQLPDEVRAAIEQVVAYHADPDRTEAMRSAAESAALSAAESAGKKSKWSVEFSAASSAWWSAREVPESAAESARLAGRAAAQSVWAAREAAWAEYRTQWRDFLEVAAKY